MIAVAVFVSKYFTRHDVQVTFILNVYDMNSRHNNADAFSASRASKIISFLKEEKTFYKLAY